MNSVKLPKVLGIQHPRWFFKALAWVHRERSVVFSGYTKETEITPAGYALLELLFYEARVKRVSVEGIHFKPMTGAIHAKNYSLDWFDRSLKPLFFERFVELRSNTLTDDRQFELALLFNELTQNALDHAGSERFIVLLEDDGVGVFDLGVSIPAKMEQSHPSKPDVNAIEFALEKGVTTRRERSGGFGLYYTLDQLRDWGGYLFVASRKGQLRRYLKSKKIDRKQLPEPMTGTLIYCSAADRSRKRISK
jgi:hypothetical protein